MLPESWTSTTGHLGTTVARARGYATLISGLLQPGKETRGRSPLTVASAPPHGALPCGRTFGAASRPYSRRPSCGLSGPHPRPLPFVKTVSIKLPEPRAALRRPGFPDVPDCCCQTSSAVSISGMLKLPPGSSGSSAMSSSGRVSPGSSASWSWCSQSWRGRVMSAMVSV